MENGFHREWRVADAATGHPLSQLQGRELSEYRLQVLLGLKNRFGATYFYILIKNSSGGVSRQPVVTGLYNRGSCPANNWIEVINIAYRVDFDSSEREDLDSSSDRLTTQLLRYMVDLLPPGGHIMVEYEGEKQLDMERLLSRGVPPAATPLGYELFNAGCGFSFKDWYFAEGGTKGHASCNVSSL